MRYSQIEGGGILQHVAELGRVLPVPISFSPDTDEHLRLAVFGKVAFKEKFLLFTFGLFGKHKPMTELFIVLPGGWNRLDPAPGNQFPVQLLDTLYHQVSSGMQIDETTFISADDEHFKHLAWPPDICGFWPADVHWGLPAGEATAPDESVRLLTLLPVRRTKKSARAEP